MIADGAGVGGLGVAEGLAGGVQPWFGWRGGQGERGFGQRAVGDGPEGSLERGFRLAQFAPAGVEANRRLASGPHQRCEIGHGRDVALGRHRLQFGQGSGEQAVGLGQAFACRGGFEGQFRVLLQAPLGVLDDGCRRQGEGLVPAEVAAQRRSLGPIGGEVPRHSRQVGLGTQRQAAEIGQDLDLGLGGDPGGVECQGGAGVVGGLQFQSGGGGAADGRGAMHQGIPPAFFECVVQLGCVCGVRQHLLGGAQTVEPGAAGADGAQPVTLAGFRVLFGEEGFQGLGGFGGVAFEGGEAVGAQGGAAQVPAALLPVAESAPEWAGAVAGGGSTQIVSPALQVRQQVADAAHAAAGGEQDLTEPALAADQVFAGGAEQGGVEAEQFVEDRLVGTAEEAAGLVRRDFGAAGERQRVAVAFAAHQ